MTLGSFQPYDYGYKENMRRYKHSKPPPYDLTKVKIPMVVFYSDMDQIVPPKVSMLLFRLH